MTTKIHAYKRHRAVAPILKVRMWLVPMAVGEFFRDGALRCMGPFHDVRPADKALQYLDGNREGGRMDRAALGYDGDPLDASFGQD